MTLSARQRQKKLEKKKKKRQLVKKSSSLAPRATGMAKKIVAQLDRICGSGNFNYFVALDDGIPE